MVAKIKRGERNVMAMVVSDVSFTPDRAEIYFHRESESLAVFENLKKMKVSCERFRHTNKGSVVIIYDREISISVK